MEGIFSLRLFFQLALVAIFGGRFVLCNESGLKYGMTPGANLFVAEQNATQPIVRFNSDEELHELLQTHSNTSAILLDTRSNVAYSDIVSVKVPSGNSTYDKLDYTTNYDQWSQTWKQWKVAQQGDWWASWYPISTCVNTGLSSGEAEYSLTWEYSYSWSVTYTGGFSWSIISATAEYSVTKEVSRSGTLDCHIPANSVGQVWYQQHMLWADYQVQNCKRTPANKIECGAYSGYIRANAPFSSKGSDGYQLGCSTGSNNVKC
ncbi:hypothetical protein MOSE0_J09868 [Monosporozyma servazzii]